ncbi:phenolphthiocerol synthesis polyketide synthase type I Pks15/1 domain protein [Mycobacterium avium subsp. avium 2285 (R)]|nr:phenolphthiocerol synthesis polyketide synthase type I Pks15/1 domain protein [Mycobacterium avium subsp. avium 2285 (R)]
MSVVTMPKGRPEVDSLLTAAARLFTAGARRAMVRGVHRPARPPGRPADVCLCAARFWLSGDAVGSANIASLGWPRPSTRCWARCWTGGFRWRGVDRPALDGRPAVAGRPRGGGTVLFPARVSWNWRCAPATRSAARWSRS